MRPPSRPRVRNTSGLPHVEVASPPVADEFSSASVTVADDVELPWLADDAVIVEHPEDVAPETETLEQSEDGVLRLSDRLAERARAARRLAWRRILIIVGVLALAGGAVYGLFFSSLLALHSDKIQVNAADGRLDHAAVEHVLAENVGVPLPRLSMSGIERSLESIPTVHEATAHRAWPNGLNVDVIPRIPVAAVPADGGVHLYDAEGVDLGFEAAAPEGLPTVNVAISDETAEVLTSLLQVLNDLGDLRGSVVDAGAEGLESIEFTLASGAKVRWGGNSENDLKLAVLLTLMEHTQARLYDVSTPRTPISQ